MFILAEICPNVCLLTAVYANGSVWRRRGGVSRIGVPERDFHLSAPFDTLQGGWCGLTLVNRLVVAPKCVCYTPLSHTGIQLENVYVIRSR